MSGFGQSNAFGSSSTNNNNGGFGTTSGSSGAGFSSSAGGFGSSKLFGQPQQPQPPFGSSTTATAPTGFGGFGTTPAPTNTSAAASASMSGFGTTPFGNNSGGGTPAIGAGFGGGTSSSSAFGTSSGGFGSSANNTTTTGGGTFGSSVNNAPPPTSSSSSAFGFGQQQQHQQSQPQQMGFGSSNNNSNNNFGGGGSSTSAAPIMAFGSSSTVLATPQHQQQQPQQQPTTSSFGSNINVSTSGFGSASTTANNNAGFGSSSNTSTGFGASTSTGFGTSTSTGFGTSNTTGFGSSNTTTGSATTGFGSFNTTATPSSSSFGSSSQQQPPSSNLSVNATPFAPSTSNTSGGGFGMSSTTTGGATTTNNAFGSGGFGASEQGAAAAPSTAFGVGGAFGSQTTAASSSAFGNTPDGGSNNNNLSSSFPFGARIPRKDKSSSSNTTTAAATNTADHETVPDGGGDAQLAALRAKIQEKKQKLLDKKKAQQQQQQQQQLSPSRTSATTTSATTAAATATDNDRNAELAAKNALRFASQQDNKGLSSLLPTDLQNAAASYTASTSAGGDGSDDINDVGDDNDEVDDDDFVNNNNNRNVNNAKSLIGICKSMCPDEELLRREREGDIQLLEITDPGGLHPSHWTLRDTAVKRFRRSAADFKLDIPELVRPPEVLERVCGYLEEWVMERDRQGPDKRWAQAATTTSDTPPPLDVYQFIWDRTRMIRKDFILQNYIGTGGKCDARAVRCHERIARWHAMCEHQLSHIPDFVKHQSQQNIAELGQTMKTLNLYYDDALGRALTEPASSGDECLQGCASDIVMGKSPIDFDGSALSNDAQSADVAQRIVGKNGINSPSLGTAEPEMRGLYILLTMNNEGGMEVLKYSGRLCTQKPEIFYSKPVQLALSIFQAKKDHNYAKFFRLLRCPSTPYLFSCIMFKYVENMRKETLMLMSKVYGARHKTTGEAFFDSYPLERLVNLLCYEDESEASEACRHYGITVEGDQVLWRHSKFREPRDQEKGIIIPLKPRKMIRTIESKLNGATRLSVCRGGVSGEGATLSKAPTSVDADTLLKERQKAQEEMKKKLAEAKAREEAERRKQEKIKEERLRQERLEAENRAREEAAKRAEQERMRKEQLEKERLEREKQERERIAAEEKARKEAAERAERLRREKEAREKKEREIAEAKRLAEEERKRKLAEEERIRRLEEEKRRREEEERRRIARELELKRKAEEERIRKAKEEEERRIEMAWREKVANAKKLLISRLLRKHMRKHDSMQKSRNSLSKLDPTCTQYPKSVKQQVSRDLFCNTTSSTEAITRRLGSGVDELENQMYRLATAPRQQMDLSKLLQDCIAKSCHRYQPNESYPVVVRPAGPVKLFKLAILLPSKSEQCEHLRDTLRMWVESHLELDEVFSSTFSIRTFQVDARTVAVIGNEDVSNCKGCDAVLVLLPSFTEETVRLDFPEKALELLEQNIPRMVLVLDTMMDVSCRSAPADMTVKWIDTILGDGTEGHPSDLQQREGVAAPNPCDFDLAFCKCCQVLVQAHIETTLCHNNESSNSIVRISLSDLGFLCLQRLIQNMDESGFFHSFSPPTSSYITLFDICKNTLSSLSHQLSTAQEEIHQQWQQGCSGWPSQEFFTSERGIESFFGGNDDLPFDWHEPKSNLGNELKLFFQHLLERTTLTLFVQSVVDSLHDGVGQDLLIMLENGEISSCFSTIVSMVVDGEINLVSGGQQTILYLPTNTLTLMIERVAAYELPESEPDNEIPGYLIWGLPAATTAVDFEEEEKENNQHTPTPNTDEVAATAATTTLLMESKDKSITSYKRRFSDHAMIEPDLEEEEGEEEGKGRNDDRQKSVKRTKLNKISTEEERSSKSFTSYLQALLGDV